MKKPFTKIVNEHCYVKKLTACLLLLSIGLKGAIVKAQSPVGDVVGKITVGYQGWFAEPNDGSPYNNWWHWTAVGGAPSATNTGIKAWPDEREFATTFATAYNNLPSGQPANLFSSYPDQTINTQFLWMQQNGIDCAALQRFNPTGGEGPIRDSVTKKVRIAAEANSVKFYIMYDVSGWTNMQTEMKADWTNKMSAYTASSAYAMQNGKPVVCIWGLGLNDANHAFTSAVCVDVINWFKTQGCYVIGGVRGEWRTVNDGYINTYNALNMISPWMIGKIGSIADENNYYANTNIADQAYCNANGIDYQPCILPGDLKERQRAHGDFMWRQFYNMKSLNTQAIYISMFDEFNEGNQIVKTAESQAQMPVNSGYLGLDEDGTAVSADYYLRLTNDGGKMFKGQIALTATRPTPYFVNAAPVITNLATASAPANTYLSFNIGASNGPASFNATSLPPGLSVNTTTGLISGIPTTVGNYTTTLSATNATGTGSLPISFAIITPAPQSAYGGTSWPVPGKIEAENFDIGGQGVAYNDNDAANVTGQYRTTEGVDIEGCSDAGGGYDIGFTNAGEWMEYTVNVATAGTYTFQARMATPNTSNTFHIEVDGYNISGSISVPNSSGYQTWETVNFTTPIISSGQHVIRFYEETGGYNINYINFILATIAEAPYGGTAITIPGKLEAENYDLGGQGVAYNDLDSVNKSGQYRTTEGVDIETTGDVGGGYDVLFTNAGEWMKYTVNVTTTSAYALEARVSSPYGGEAMHVELDGINISGTLAVPNTGDWQVYQTVSAITPSISSGQHVIRIYEESDGFNINYLNFTTKAAVLPVTFTRFAATPNSCATSLIFETLNEQNNSYFIIEYSIDAVTWQALTNLPSKGNEGGLYNYLQNNPLNGIGYYRVKQVDVDGHFSFGSTISIYNNCNGKPAIAAFPNPVKNLVTLKGISVGSQLRLLDITGKTLLVKTTNGSELQQLNLNSLTKGIYLLKVIDNNGLSTVIKLSKQ